MTSQFEVPSHFCDSHDKKQLPYIGQSNTTDRISELLVHNTPRPVSIDTHQKAVETFYTTEPEEHPRPWRLGEFHASYVPRRFNCQPGLDANAERVQSYIDKYLPHVDDRLLRDAVFDGVAKKYVDWRVYAMKGPFKSKFGRVKSFSHKTAVVEFESMASTCQALQTANREHLMV